MSRFLALLLILLAAALPAALPVRAEGVTLSGEVTYRERLDLPAGATLRIELVDRAAPDIAIVGAAAALASPGQVPLSFALTFDDRLLAPTSDYGLVAEIVAEGTVWFRNAAPLALDPLQPPEDLELVLSFTGEAASPDEPVPVPAGVSDTPPELLGTVWQAEAIRDVLVVGGSEPSLSIAEDLRAGGRGSCNSYFAQAVVTAGSLRFSEVASTRMACAEAVAAQEEAYFAALGATRFWRVTGDRLHLLDDSGREVLRFTRTGR